MQINFAGIIQGKEEERAVLRVLKSKWHASGYECSNLEEELAKYLGVKYCIIVNSGTAANFLALKSLELPYGSKILTSACGFSMTLSPILYAGLKPVFVDYSLPEHNINIKQIEETLSNDKNIKAIILAHTMGLPVDMVRINKISQKYNIKVIEDCCEATGTKLNGKYVGTFNYIGTFSFYPSHQLNGLGGGGCLATNDVEIAKKITSIREWGKYIDYPFKGFHTTKLDTKIDDIMYDKQYTYTNIGFNLKYPEVNCAYLRVQLKKLNDFIQKRKKNYEYLKDKLNKFNFIQPKIIDKAEPSYFGYVITCRERGERDRLVYYLESKGIKTRVFFGGNLTRHPAFKQYYKKNKYPIADYLMRNSLFVGVWQGLKIKDMDYIYRTIKESKL